MISMTIVLLAFLLTYISFRIRKSFVLKHANLDVILPINWKPFLDRFFSSFALPIAFEFLLVFSALMINSVIVIPMDALMVLLVSAVSTMFSASAYFRLKHLLLMEEDIRFEFVYTYIVHTIVLVLILFSIS
jgi:hypothetical protein